MTVVSRGAALDALQPLSNYDPVPAKTILRHLYLPDGPERSQDPVGMDLVNVMTYQTLQPEPAIRQVPKE